MRRAPRRIACYTHPTPPPSQEPDPRPGFYYVSVRDPDDPARFGLLAGPYPTHRQALDLVPTVRSLAEDVNWRSAFYAFGTCRTETGEYQGRLNDRLPEMLDTHRPGTRITAEQTEKED